MKRIAFFFFAMAILSFEMKGQTTIALPDTNFAKYLTISYSWIMSGNRLIISEAAKIKRPLNLTGRNIRNAQGIQYFTGTSAIDLSNNLLTSLPDFLRNDTLDALVLNNNQLTQLPDLSRLTKLHSLDVVANQLTQLNGIEKLKSLQKLICNENVIRQLPALDSLPNLIALDASYNQIVQFPSVGKANKIQVIHLNDNKLTALPDSLHFPKLKKMWLYNNHLTFSDLSKLTSVKGYDTLFAVYQQLEIREGRTLQAKEYSSFSLSCHTDSGLVNTTHTWYKDGSIYQKGQTLSFSKALPTVAGKYVCVITNSSVFKNLNLQTDTFNVSITPCIDVSKFFYSTVSINCKRSGQVLVQDKAHQQVTYVLKSTASSHHYTTINGTFSGLSEPSYQLLFHDANGCEKEYPTEIKILKEECKQALITPNGDGESDSFYFTHTGSVTIYDKRGEIVRVLSIPNEWDGIAKNGRVSPGAYLADINNGEELLNISVVY